MTTAAQPEIIGRVLRATTNKYTCGTHSLKVDNRHDFGAFVKAPAANDERCAVIGLIYAVEIKDDQLITELVMAEGIDPNVMRDQRENRLVPVEIDVLSVGYGYRDASDYVRDYVHSLPPRPPMSLSDVRLCSAEEVYQFTQSCDFFRLVITASDVPSDDLLAAALRYAAWAYPDEQRYDFMVRCGRHLTRLLANDLRRLSHVLTLIRPQ
jgi:hypothetical protein